MTSPFATKTIDVDTLNDEQVELVRRFVEFLRKAKDREQTRQGLKRLWSEWAKTAPPISDADADRLAAEAVAYARGHV